MSRTIDTAARAMLDGRASVSWAELDRRCDALADRLRSAGVPAGGVVALDGSPSLEAAVSVLAIVRAGAVAAPLPDSRTAAETGAILALLDPVLLLGRDEVARPGRSLDGPGVVVLTSGTTAAPRGVVLPTAALDASASAWLGALPAATGWLLALGLSHVAGIGVLWRAVAERVPIRIEAPGDPAAQLAALRGFPALSHVSLVPTQLARLLDEAGDGPPPPTLRAVLLGGGIVPPGLVTRALAGGWPVVPTYGLSEAGSGVTALPTDEARSHPASAGRALPGVVVSITDPDADGIGEIVVSTPARFAGYVGEARSDGPIRTGDLGRLDDAGRLFVVDRRTDRIVRGGENVSPAEVEAVLTALPWVADAAVVARRDGAHGQVPVAAVVPRRDVADAGDDAILRACRDSLAGYKVPSAIVRLDAVPRTAGGKLRRDAVRALVDGEPNGILARPGGDEIGWRVAGSGLAPILLLPGTLSNAAQLGRLATELADAAEATVHAIDRRGMGTSRLADPAPLDVDVHVRDLVAYLDARGIGRATVLGVSFGGVVALELAARHRERVARLVVWEPPYGPAADDATRGRFATLAADTAAAHHKDGAPGAAETFLRAVAGDAAWDRLPPRGRDFLAREGDAALTDSALVGLDLEGLGRIEASITILSGSSSEPIYTPIADALAARIPGARRRTLDGLAHPAPITDPARIAEAFHDAVGRPSTTDPVPLESPPVTRTKPKPPDALPAAAPAGHVPSGAAPSGAATEAGNAAPTPEVRAMFDRISGVYDPMNLAISAFQEPYWRGRLVRAAGLRPGMRALDVASGTGKVAADLQRRTQPGGRVLGVDISPGMIDIASRQYGDRPGLAYVVGDALALPTGDASFDAATIAFGMRNLPDYRRGFEEMARSVRPGGRVLCLEIARPRSRLARFMRWWFDRIVPLIGRVAGQGDAYAYLVRSVRAYPAPERIAEIMGEAGLVDVHWQGLTGGIVTLHVGTVPRR